MAEPVAAMCEQLIKAVTVIMDAESNHRYRLEALKVPGLEEKRLATRLAGSS